MKKILTLLFATAIIIGATAQTKKMAVGGYGAGTAELTFINGKAALNIGAYGGVLLNHKLLIGAGGSNIFFSKKINGQKEDFQFNYYGVYSEYRFMPERKLNVTVSVLGAMGWNENKLVSDKGSMKKDGDYTYAKARRHSVRRNQSLDMHCR